MPGLRSNWEDKRVLELSTRRVLDNRQQSLGQKIKEIFFSFSATVAIYTMFDVHIYPHNTVLSCGVISTSPSARPGKSLFCWCTPNSSMRSHYTAALSYAPQSIWHKFMLIILFQHTEIQQLQLCTQDSINSTNARKATCQSKARNAVIDKTLGWSLTGQSVIIVNITH